MIAVAVAKHIDANVTGVTRSTTAGAGNLFLGRMPDQPDEAVAVMPQPGRPQYDRSPTDLPNVQVIVRGAKRTPMSGYERARAIYDALNCLDGVTLDPGGDDEVFLIGCTAQQSDPIPLGPDALERPEWSINFALTTHQPTTHRPA